MHISSQSVKIVAAVIIAVAMIGTSFWLTNPQTKLASALSTDELLRAYVEQDTDGDGLPDWQEKVYGTDPANPQSVETGMTDQEAVASGLVAPAFVSEEAPDPITKADIPVEDPSPNSLTKRFSEQFIEAYFAAGGGSNVSEVEQQQIVDNLLTLYTKEAEKMVVSSYTNLSVRTDNSVSFDSYINQLAVIFTKNSVPTEDANPLVLAERLIELNDQEALKKIGVLQSVYDNFRKDLLLVAVPEEVKGEHLALLRGFDTFSRMMSLLGDYEADPIASLGSLSMFEPNSESIMEAFRSLATTVLESGEPASGTAGELIVNVARSTERP